MRRVSMRVTAVVSFNVAGDDDKNAAETATKQFLATPGNFMNGAQYDEGGILMLVVSDPETGHEANFVQASDGSIVVEAGLRDVAPPETWVRKLMRVEPVEPAGGLSWQFELRVTAAQMVPRHLLHMAARIVRDGKVVKDTMEGPIDVVTDLMDPRIAWMIREVNKVRVLNGMLVAGSCEQEDQ